MIKVSEDPGEVGVVFVVGVARPVVGATPAVVVEVGSAVDLAV